MAKTREELNKRSKQRRLKHKEANKNLKLTKNWYPVTDNKRHFRRPNKKVRAPSLRKDIQPGQVLILLSGRFRGRRVIFLKRLESGLLLVTGPYKLNGVPLKRVNQAYVIPTKTRVPFGTAPGLDKVGDDFFKNRVAVKRGTKPSDFFEDSKKKRERITDEKRNSQNTVDTEVIKAVKTTPNLREYLQNRFALKNGDKPHLMNF